MKIEQIKMIENLMDKKRNVNNINIINNNDNEKFFMSKEKESCFDYNISSDRKNIEMKQINDNNKEIENKKINNKNKFRRRRRRIFII